MDEVMRLVREYHEEHGVPPKLLRDLGLARPQTVELPRGVDHELTTTVARSWEDYDALTAEDGWESKGELTRWKEARISGHLIAVFKPTQQIEGPR